MVCLGGEAEAERSRTRWAARASADAGTTNRCASGYCDWLVARGVQRVPGQREPLSTCAASALSTAALQRVVGHPAGQLDGQGGAGLGEECDLADGGQEECGRLGLATPEAIGD